MGLRKLQRKSVLPTTCMHVLCLFSLICLFIFRGFFNSHLDSSYKPTPSPFFLNIFFINSIFYLNNYFFGTTIINMWIHLFSVCITSSWYYLIFLINFVNLTVNVYQNISCMSQILKYCCYFFMGTKLLIEFLYLCLINIFFLQVVMVNEFLIYIYFFNSIFVDSRT